MIFDILTDAPGTLPGADLRRPIKKIYRVKESLPKCKKLPITCTFKNSRENSGTYDGIQATPSL